MSNGWRGNFISDSQFFSARIVRAVFMPVIETPNPLRMDAMLILNRYPIKTDHLWYNIFEAYVIEKSVRSLKARHGEIGPVWLAGDRTYTWNIKVHWMPDIALPVQIWYLELNPGSDEEIKPWKQGLTGRTEVKCPSWDLDACVCQPKMGILTNRDR